MPLRRPGLTPRRAAAVAAGLAGLLAAAFLPVVTGRATLLPLDAGVMADGPWGYTGPRPAPAVYDPAASAIKYVPYTALVSRLWRAGTLPFWNPWNGAGVPLWANGESFATAPLRLPLYLHPSPAMWNAWWLGRLWLAGGLAAALALRLGLTAAAAFAAGAAWMLGGYLVLSLNLMHLDVDLLLPGALLALEALLGAPGARGPWLATAAAAWGMALGGGPQAMVVNALFLAAWVAVRARDRRGAGRAGWAAAAGAAAALPFWLPFLELVRRAHHLHGADGSRGGASSVPAGALPALLGPWAVPGPGLPPYYYAGLAACGLALLGGWQAWRGRRDPATPAFRLCAAAVAFELWKIFGGPGATAFGALPGASLLWWGKYAAPLFLGLALLAGRGVEAFAGRSAWRGWALAGLVAAELVALRPGPLAAPHDPLAPAPYVAWLRGRLAAEPGWRICGVGNVLMPDLAAAFALPDVRLEDSAIDRDQYRVLFEGFSAPKPPRLSMFMTLDVLDPRRLEALRGLGVRWLLAAPDWAPPAATASALSRAYAAEISIWRVAGARRFAGWPERGRRALALGIWAGGVLGPGLLLAGLAGARPPRRARSG